jgi:hypothetical protein
MSRTAPGQFSMFKTGPRSVFDAFETNWIFRPVVFGQILSASYFRTVFRIPLIINPCFPYDSRIRVKEQRPVYVAMKYVAARFNIRIA